MKKAIKFAHITIPKNLEKDGAAWPPDVAMDRL